MKTSDDTIYALASPPGRGGVAVVRVSGPKACESLCAIAGRGAECFPSRRAVLRTFRDPVSRETIDKGLALFFQAPASFTGEDIAEYHLHGGMAVVRAMLEALSRQPGHRLALPGEFTRRAFENGKLDLTEAEAVADLINAETALQKAQALDQLGGALSALYEGWAAALKKALAHLEADLEFPDEDMPEGIAPQILPILATIAGDIAAHLADNRRGERLREGIHIAVIGAPNAGKSSLVNALARREIAIVSPHAGTTRDVIETHLDLNGYPVILSDTAGLRPEALGDSPQDCIESEGIRRALERARQADIKLLLFDATEIEPDPGTLAQADDTAVIVLNKTDEPSPFGRGRDPRIAWEGEGPLTISAKTGAGLETLIAALTAKIETLIAPRETPSLTRARHREALKECSASLARAAKAPLPELMAEDVRLSVRALGRITGRVDVEDVLDVIFRDFCIGK